MVPSVVDGSPPGSELDSPRVDDGDKSFVGVLNVLETEPLCSATSAPLLPPAAAGPASGLNMSTSRSPVEVRAVRLTCICVCRRSGVCIATLLGGAPESTRAATIEAARSMSASIPWGSSPRSSHGVSTVLNSIRRGANGSNESRIASSSVSTRTELLRLNAKQNMRRARRLQFSCMLSASLFTA